MIRYNNNRILSKVNQIIYTLSTFCVLNIMALAQEVLAIFCSQGDILHKITSKREIILSNINKSFTKSYSQFKDR